MYLYLVFLLNLYFKTHTLLGKCITVKKIRNNLTIRQHIYLSGCFEWKLVLRENCRQSAARFSRRESKHILSTMNTSVIIAFNSNARLRLCYCKAYDLLLLRFGGI